VNRIGESVEPCGTPALIANGGDSFPWMTSVVVRSVRNALTQCTSYSGNPFFRRISNIRIGCTISKAPERSRDNSVAICFGDFQTVYTCSVSSSRAVSVDLDLRAPIWVSGSRWCSSVIVWILFAVTASMSLLMVLRSAIGLQEPGSLYDCLLGLRRTIVRVCLSCAG
jgi:hypothetical protein